MNEASLKAMLAGASESTRRLNPATGIAGPVAKLERRAGMQVSAPAPHEGRDQSRHVVRFIVHTRRQLDDENHCTKWFTDCLVKAGIIFDDNRRHCRVFVLPVTVTKDQPEKIIIEVWRIGQ